MFENVVQELFAGVYTKNGYKPLLKEYTEECKDIYILKGTSGCGKSTLLKRLCGNADNNGIKYTIIRCSSDNNSLDGVIFTKKNIAVLDGTAPHVMNCDLPLIKHHLINLAELYGDIVPEQFREKLSSLIKEKQSVYLNAYRLLEAYRAINGIIRSEIEAVILKDKLNAYTDKLSLKSQNGGYKAKTCAYACFSRKGFVFTPPKESHDTIIVNDIFGSSETILNSVYEKVYPSGNVEAIPSPLDASVVIGIYFTRKKLLLISNRYFNADSASVMGKYRFIDKEKLSIIRSKLCFYNKLQDSVLDEIHSLFEKAGALHEEIERLYAPFIDYSVADDTFERLKDLIAEA